MSKCLLWKGRSTYSTWFSAQVKKGLFNCVCVGRATDQRSAILNMLKNHNKGCFPPQVYICNSWLLSHIDYGCWYIVDVMVIIAVVLYQHSWSASFNQMSWSEQTVEIWNLTLLNVLKLHCSWNIPFFPNMIQFSIISADSKQWHSHSQTENAEYILWAVALLNSFSLSRRFLTL